MDTKTKLIVAGFTILLGYTYFNRNPIRYIPISDNVIVSPADGTITQISNNKIDIHIGITDVHIQRAPYDGTILDIYGDSSGHYIILNNLIYGDFIIERKGVPLINNVMTFVKKGDIINKGDIIGKITFGSFCSIQLPLISSNTTELHIVVREGQHILAGESIIAIV